MGFFFQEFAVFLTSNLFYERWNVDVDAGFPSIDLALVQDSCRKGFFFFFFY